MTSGAGTVTGSGTSGYVPTFNGTGSINNSVIFQNGTNVGIGTVTPGSLLTVGGGNDNLNYSVLINPASNAIASLALVSTGGNGGAIYFGSSGVTNGMMTYNYNIGNAFEFFGSNNFTNRLLLLAPTYASFSGNVGIGTTSPTKKFEVNGTVGALNIDVTTSMPTINTTTNNVTITSQGGSVIIRLG